MPDKKETKKGKDTLKKVGWFALKTAGISAAVLGGAAVAVPAMGFTAGGVVAGSLAAAFQSACLGGTIASGSAFAVLQSVGAVGLAASTQAGVVAGSAVAAGLHTIFKKKGNNSGDEGSVNNNSDEGKNTYCNYTAVLKKNVNEANVSNTDVMKKNETDTDETDNEGKETQAINLICCNCANTAAEIVVNEKEANCEERMDITSSNDESDRKMKSQSTSYCKCAKVWYCCKCATALLCTKCAEFDKLNANLSKKRKIDIQEMDFLPEPQVDPRWGEMQLTDDIAITHHILKKKYPY